MIAILNEVDWPWSSDKALVTCDVCKIGMLVLLSDLIAEGTTKYTVHKICMKQIPQISDLQTKVIQ